MLNLINPFGEITARSQRPEAPQVATRIYPLSNRQGNEYRSAKYDHYCGNSPFWLNNT